MFHNAWMSNKLCHIDLPKKADVVIVGGGLAGLLTLYQLISSNAFDKVLLLEETIIGHGASARGNGQLVLGGREAMSTTAEQMGLQKAQILFSSMAANIQSFGDFIKRENIACDYAQTGGVHLAVNRQQFHSLRKSAEMLTDFCPTILTLKDLKLIAWSDSWSGGVLYPNEAVLNPYKLITELANKFTNNIRELCSVTEVREVKKGLEVRVRNRGSVLASSVIYCNSFGVGGLECYRHHMMSVPLAENHIWPSMSFVSGLGWDHFRTYGSKLIFGGCRHKDNKYQFGVCADGQLDNTIINTMKYRTSGKPECEWTMTVCRHSDMLPVVGPIPGLKGQFMNVGYDEYGLNLAYLGSLLTREYLISGKSSLPIAPLLSTSRM